MITSILLIRTFFSMVVSFTFAILFQVRGKNVFFAALNGGIGFFIYSIYSPFGNFFAPFLASAAIMLYAEIFARVRKTPATVFLGAALIPIVPGGSLYNTMIQAFAGNPEKALTNFYSAFIETAGIALGIVLVSSIMLAIFRKNPFRKKVR